MSNLTAVNQPSPIPRPRQCWKQSVTKNDPEPELSISKQSSNSTTTNKQFSLSEDDIQKFLGKQFSLPRSSLHPSGTDKDQKEPVQIVNPRPLAVTQNRLTQHDSNTKEINPTTTYKPPIPLPRTMFLAIRTPPTLPSRPPVGRP